MCRLCHHWHGSSSFRRLSSRSTRHTEIILDHLGLASGFEVELQDSLWIPRSRSKYGVRGAGMDDPEGGQVACG